MKIISCGKRVDRGHPSECSRSTPTSLRRRSPHRTPGFPLRSGRVRCLSENKPSRLTDPGLISSPDPVRGIAVLDRRLVCVLEAVSWSGCVHTEPDEYRRASLNVEMDGRAIEHIRDTAVANPIVMLTYTAQENRREGETLLKSDHREHSTCGAWLKAQSSLSPSVPLRALCATEPRQVQRFLPIPTPTPSPAALHTTRLGT